MKQHTINTYAFSELSESAQRTAIENERNSWYENCDYINGFGNDNVNSLKAFLACFDCSAKDYSLGGSASQSFIEVNFPTQIDEDVMCGRKLYSLVYMIAYSEFMQRKRYSKGGKVVRSKITKEWACCPLTGYCADEWLIDVVKDFLSGKLSVNYDTFTFRDFIELCCNAFIKAYCEDEEWYYTDAHISEYFGDNDYEFFENGKVFNL